MLYNKAVTLIELIMVIAIIGIIALASGEILIFFMRNTIYLPNQLNVQQIADTAMDLMIEGDLNVRGLRFAGRVTEAGNNRIQFRNVGGRTVTYEILNNVINRSVDGGANEPIPYYATGNIAISGENNTLFRYYDINENTATNPQDVRRVEIKLIAQSGTGSVGDWEGRAALGSSIKMYRFNQPPVFTAAPTASPGSIPLGGSSTISFSVNDPDGGQVTWTATRTGNPRGALTPASGIGTVLYNASLIFQSTTRRGTATIAIRLNDGNGGTNTASVPIRVY